MGQQILREAVIFSNSVAPSWKFLDDCRLNLEQLVESMSEQEIVFDLTGQVFVYHGRNYLLPTHAPRLVEYVPPPPAVADDGVAPLDADSGEALLRELERTVGPAVRSSRRGAASRDDRDPDRPKLLAPGTVLLRRRGWMNREPDAAWSFIFGADAAGLADPSMILLPCLMLEVMEDAAQTRGHSAPLLVSGRVYRYHQRNYLLPTLFQIPNLRTPLFP